MSIKVTGIGRVDDATAEIALALREAGPGKRDQEYYDEAMRLRDEILAGAAESAPRVKVCISCDQEQGQPHLPTCVTQTGRL